MSRKLRLVGLDLSLTATGVCDAYGADTIRVKLPKDATDTERVERLKHLAKRIDIYLIEGPDERGKADLVVLEGPSFHSENSHAHSLGELAGVVKVVMLQRGIPFVIVAPSTMKKFATGKGNAPKDAVFAAAVRASTDLPFTVEDNNQGDAFWLYTMAVTRDNPDIYRAASIVRQQVLDAIEWPELREKEVAVG